MGKTEIIALLAIPMPSNELFEEDGKQRHRADLYATLDELNSLSGVLDFPLFELGVHTPTIELLQGDRQDDAKLAHWFAPRTLEQCEILKFSIEVPCPSSRRLDELYGLSDHGPRIDPQAVFLLFSRHFFAKRIADLLVMANISRVGSIELSDSVLIQDGVNMHSTLPRIDAWSLQRAVILAESMGWPNLHTFQLSQAWRWAVEREDLLDGFSGSSTGRVLNAFSRLLEDTGDEGPMKLLWALVGIEALYVKGNVALIEQVREKTQVLLGPQEAYKKKIGQMYEFRSRFVHGDLDFPPLYLAGDARDEVSRYDVDLLDSIALASAILAATLQEIIQRNWDGLEFSYSVSNSR